MTHVSTSRKVLLLAVGVLIVLPTLLGVLLGTVSAAAQIYEFIFIQGGPTVVVGLRKNLIHLAMTVLGWVGFITALKLQIHFLRSSAVPAWHQRAWAGLACGVITCISLINWIETSLTLRLILMIWPLSAALIFAGLLASAQKRKAAKGL